MKRQLATADKMAAENDIQVMQFDAPEKNIAAFHAAQRHSVMVRFLKIALPIAALLVAGVFSWFTFLSAPASVVTVNLGGDAENGQLVMTSPNLSGFTKDNLPYSMMALKATQNTKEEGIIVLEGISAELPVGQRGTAHVSAASGRYDNINGRLQLDKDFTVTTDQGLDAKMQSADVNIATGQIRTDKPVDIRSGTMHIRANRMQIEGNGESLIFEDKVELEISPQADAAVN